MQSLVGVCVLVNSLEPASHLIPLSGWVRSGVGIWIALLGNAGTVEIRVVIGILLCFYYSLVRHYN